MRLISMIFILLLFAQLAIAQEDVVDQIMSSGVSNSAEMFSEKIKIISRSKKIFILSNDNGLLGKGDFITLVLNNTEPVVRALVVKNQDENTGIKIMKIYSLKRWARLHQDLEVQILKGDDTQLFVKKAPKLKADPTETENIDSEEDLYNDVAIIDGEVGFESKDNRHIKPDNIVGIAIGQYSFKDNISGDTIQNNQLYGHWAYQFADNYWAEGVFGRTLVQDFPAKAASTLIVNYTIRAKYTFKAPLYSYIMPYIGYQMYTVSSPEAGNSEDIDLANAELKAVDDLSKRSIVAGATILRRLVPGWFLKADVGTDGLNIGFTVEF